MNFGPFKPDPAWCLAGNEYLRLDAEPIRDKAAALFAGAPREVDRIAAAFEFVRDAIHHSADIGSSRVTRTALEVLEYGEGICYAKTMLLAALLRVGGIPTGFCYQRLAASGLSGPTHSIHALNAVYIASEQAWVRLDARGNTGGKNACFYPEDPLREQLAFRIRPELGELSYPEIRAEHHEAILAVLRRYYDCRIMLRELPGEL